MSDDVGHERHVPGVRRIVPLGAEDRVVGREVHVGGVRIERQLALLGTRVNLSASVDAAIFTAPTRFASLTAFSTRRR